MEKLAEQILKILSGIQSWTMPKNWLLRIVSLFFAIFLWYFVAGEDTVDKNVVVPVEIVNLPRDLVISNQFKKQLEVTVSGPRGLVKELSQQLITRSIDLSKEKPGTVVVKNEPDSIPFPRRVRVLRIQPTHMTLLLERLIKKELAVKPVITGNPAKGFELKNISLSPPTISLDGAQSVVGGLLFLSTAEIDISDLDSSKELQVPLVIDEALSDLIGEPIVTVRINISEQIVKKTIPDLFIDYVHNAERTTYRIQPRTVKVEAEIPYSLANNTDQMDSLFKAAIDADSLPPGKYELPIKVSNPPKTKILNVSPEKVIMHISEPDPAKKRRPVQQPEGQ